MEINWKKIITWTLFGVFCLVVLLWVLNSANQVLCMKYYNKENIPFNETGVVLCKEFKISRLIFNEKKIIFEDVIK